MATVQELINESMRKLGALASGETPNTTESGDALVVLNQLLMSWNAQALPIYKITRNQITLTGAASYVLTTRPVKIKALSVVVNNANIPLRIATPDEWAGFIERGTGEYGDYLFYEDGIPLSKVHIAPKVSTGTVEMIWDKAIAGGVIGQREAFPLSGTAFYTVGALPTANWVTERPVQIKAASILAAGTIARGVDVVSAEMWAQFPRKGLQGSFAQVAWCDYGISPCTLYLAPKPPAGTLEIYTYERLVAFTGLTQDLAGLLPDGYERALAAALAVELAPEYGRAVTPDLQGQAEDAKTSVFGLNAAILGPPQPVVSQHPPPAPPPQQAPPQQQAG
jgi:hypothetical protein